MEQNSSGQGPDGGFNPAPLRDVQNWRRSRSDRMVAGVCGGMGRALNIDPVLIRVVMAVLILTGPGIIFYAAAWAMMPDEGSDRSPAQGLLGDRIRPDHPWLWPIVIGVCVFVAIAMMSSFNFGKLVPGPLVVLGVLWLVFRRKHGHSWPGRGRRSQWTGGGNPRGQWSGGGTNWVPQNPGWTKVDPTSTTPAATAPRPQDTVPTSPPQDRVTAPVQPVWTEDDPLGLYVDEPPAPVRSAAPAAPPVPGMRGVKPVVVLLTGLAIAIAWLAGAAVPLMLVVGLGTLGLGMLVGGFLGRTMALLPLGILLALGVAASTIFPTIPHQFTDTNFVATTDTTVDATSTAYHFDAGSVHLDLTKANFAKTGAKVVVDGRVGEIVVKVPENVDVTGTVRTQTGDLNLLGQHKGGHNLDATVLNDLGADGKAGPASVTLDLNLKLGSIRVERG
ncbi:phage shock protein C (PspC) family protein [Kribbella voronezhensis]|uniref:Phage shock protein C (PspC) family protein n=1 Tax=Kribbella voronezhensis TaxID=2512212 RepID=A0A4R7T9S3_9ACTN|nr:PspC domain-containing protein [Kribbella voronezhensis]TDU88742.1 phage shock protein C (PspC) family protein [Kribbella voronezhensis]